MGTITVVRVGRLYEPTKSAPSHPVSYYFLTPTMSSVPTLQLDDSNSLGEDPPTDVDRRESFDYTEITDDQIQHIFDTHTLVTNSLGMSPPSVPPEESPVAASVPFLPAVDDPNDLPNAIVEQVSPIVDVETPSNKRKLSRQRISYSKKKMLAGSSLYAAIGHVGPIDGIKGELVGVIQQCPRASNEQRFSILGV
jgi:hypothetical protein